jgi:hypothetical protein
MCFNKTRAEQPHCPRFLEAEKEEKSVEECPIRKTGKKNPGRRRAVGIKS